ncbi:MAG: DNA repair protein RecN [Elusimicrobiota bacterium]|jgi:DNA repair protein RecN (Recombination protein N)
MLHSLEVKDFAVIAELELEFSEGLNILTGETGAGKTILIEALGFLLGARASASWVRAGARRLSVAGVFDPADFPDDLRRSLDLGKGPLRVLRELDASGKARASIDGKAVPVSVLSSWGDGLVDFHGQHEHQTLLKAGAQLAALDFYAGLGPETEALAQDYGRWAALCAERDALTLSDEERGRRLEFCRFQLAELSDAKLDAGEEARLEAELPLLQNAERIRALADAAYVALYAAEGSAAEDLLKAARALADLARLDPGMESAAKAVEEARVSVEDLGRDLGRYRGSVPLDPGRLDAVLSRLDLLSRLAKKHGGTTTAALARLEALRSELAALETAGERSGGIGPELAAAEAALAERCEGLHALRVKAARSFEKALVKELRGLGMPHAEFTAAVEMEEGRYGRTGCDAVEFLLAANPGEPARPLRSVASGGELSRVMLSLKTVLSCRPSPPARGERPSPSGTCRSGGRAEAAGAGILVFDEVDAGVGGTVARSVGQRLAALGRARQVLCVTHLAQVACFGRSHIHVVKETDRGRTVVRVERLDRGRRLETLAVMLGGREPTPASRRHAQELLESIS